jgi:hypothetical protein
MMARVRLLAALLLASCASLRAGKEEAEPIAIYGYDGLPGEPPPTCKRLGKVETTRIENKEIPLDELAEAARSQGGNAIAYPKRTGFKDGFVGKEYAFRAIAFACPNTKPVTSASTSVSAKPAN